MDDSGEMSLEQIRAYLATSEPVTFAGRSREEMYRWVENTLRGQDYRRLGWVEKGWVRRYVAKMTRLSRAQVTRLIGWGHIASQHAEAVDRFHRVACQESNLPRG